MNDFWLLVSLVLLVIGIIVYKVFYVKEKVEVYK